MENGERGTETRDRWYPKGVSSAVNRQLLATVVWYCATTERLHAGYRAAIDALNFSGAVELRRPNFIDARHFQKSASHLEAVNQSSWLEQVPDQYNNIGRQPSAVPQGGYALSGHHLASRLDAEILRLRAQMSK